jgi:hypothetical protein
MRPRPLFAAWAAPLLLLAGCSTLDVHTDYDRSVDFSDYHVYRWQDGAPPFGPPAPAAAGAETPDATGVPSPLMERRLRAAVDDQLRARGFRLAQAGQAPDFLVSDHLRYKDRIETTGTGVGLGLGLGFGLGPGGYSPLGGFAGVPLSSARTRTEATLVLDFTDARTGELIWRGIATDTARPAEENGQQVREAVAAILKEYPPQVDRG